MDSPLLVFYIFFVILEMFYQRSRIFHPFSNRRRSYSIYRNTIENNSRPHVTDHRWCIYIIRSYIILLDCLPRLKQNARNRDKISEGIGEKMDEFFFKYDKIWTTQKFRIFEDIEYILVIEFYSKEDEGRNFTRLEYFNVKERIQIR